MRPGNEASPTVVHSLLEKQAYLVDSITAAQNNINVPTNSHGIAHNTLTCCLSGILVNGMQCHTTAAVCLLFAYLMWLHAVSNILARVQ